MKYFIIILSFITSLGITDCFTWAQSENCLETPMTQAAMNSCAHADFKKADAELNRIYSLIKDVYKEDKIFIDNLKQAQRTWIKLRDADFNLRFPHTDELGYYGSVFPMCANVFRTQLTLQRIAFLKQWLIGSESGDVCSGSLKTRWTMKKTLEE